MYWLQPPPYARWAAAALIVLGAAWWDLRAPATEPHPFAARSLEPGSPIATTDVEWRSLPRGTFRVETPVGSVTAVAVEPGEPLTGALLASPTVVPDDWWAVPVDLGASTAPGETVMLIVIDPPVAIPGIVVQPQRGDRISLDYRPALVAVPGERAAVVAAAEAAGLLVAAIRPTR